MGQPRAALVFGFDAARRRWPRARASYLAGLAAIAVIPLVPAPLPAATTAGVPAGWTTALTALRLPVNQIYPDAAQMRAQFRGWDLSAIVADTSPSSALGHYLTGLLGQPTVQAGQILGWHLR